MAGRKLNEFSAYRDYLQGKSGIPLLLVNKKGSGINLLDPKSGSTVKTIDNGSTVEFIDTGKEGNFYTVKYGGKIYTISYSVITKPGREKNFDMTPKNLGLTDVKWRYDDLVKATYNSLIENEEKIGPISSNIAWGMTLYAAGTAKEKQHATEFLPKIIKEYGKANIPKTIWNNFSEVIGPLYQINRKHTLFNKDKNQYDIFLPKAANYPLVDYIVYDGKKDIKISAKSVVSSSKTNTVKPNDILHLLRTNGLLSKWERTKSHAFQVIKIINENDGKSGPGIAYSYLLSKGVVRKNNKTPRKAIEEWSKTTDEFKKIFIDATNNVIYYNIMKLDNNMLPEFTMDSDSMMTHQIYFRAKDETTSEKMGIQT